MQVITKTVKILTPKINGRSADFITPAFILNCLGPCQYCYLLRHYPSEVKIAENIDSILLAVDNHVNKQPWLKTPNQTDKQYYTYDIGESTDVALHFKHTNWFYIFDYFKTSVKAKATFATKYVNPKLLEYNPEQKVRIRFSLSPQHIADILEPKTSLLIDKINAIKTFQDAGYEVHVNLSPIVITKTWIDDYKRLFDLMPDHSIPAEVIFLTHAENVNSRCSPEAQTLLWNPSIQEEKINSYGGRCVRYKYQFKHKLTEIFTEICPLPIRYIF